MSWANSSLGKFVPTEQGGITTICRDRTGNSTVFASINKIKCTDDILKIDFYYGRIAQLAERLRHMQEATGSSPVSPTIGSDTDIDITKVITIIGGISSLSGE